MKIKFAVLLFYSSIFVFAQQIDGVLKDKDTHLPIAYANIWYENKEIGTTSDINGNFTLPLFEDYLTISVLGYEKLRIKSSKYVNISLKPLGYSLDDIVIVSRKNKNQIIFGNHKKNNVTSFQNTNLPRIFCQLIKKDSANSQLKYLKEIQFVSLSQLDSSKIQIRILQNEGKPSADYLDEKIIIKVKKGKNLNKIDLSKYNIVIPDEGLFVGFEWLIVEENMRNTYDKSISKSYEPSIGHVPSNNPSMFEYKKGQWLQEKFNYSNKNNETSFDGKYSKIALNYILSD
jgi:hypothetical protein